MSSTIGVESVEANGARSVFFAQANGALPLPLPLPPREARVLEEVLEEVRALEGVRVLEGARARVEVRAQAGVLVRGVAVVLDTDG